MRNASISEQDVVKAAKALISCGRAPSVRNVRDVIGRGSYETINRYLRAGREQGLLPPVRRPESAGRSTGSARVAELEALLAENHVSADLQAREIAVLERDVDRWKGIAADYRVKYERELEKSVEERIRGTAQADQLRALKMRLNDIMRRKPVRQDILIKLASKGRLVF
ncbi:DNA-binding protein [Ferrovibrio plantarum]|uniref:DNA-binding protein n=1 Tax=Ferrovibrio plantarum TaxID=3119164 RepID=UPI003F80FDFE